MNSRPLCRTGPNQCAGLETQSTRLHIDRPPQHTKQPTASSSASSRRPK